MRHVTLSTAAAKAADEYVNQCGRLLNISPTAHTQATQKPIYEKSWNPPTKNIPDSAAATIAAKYKDTVPNTMPTPNIPTDPPIPASAGAGSVRIEGLGSGSPANSSG